MPTLPAASRTTTVESLLGLLSLRPMSGYDIKKMIEESIGNFWSESFGQIYPTLKRMAADGLVAVSEDGESGRDRKIYTLTEPGRVRLRSWLGMPAEDRVPRNELLLKLFFGERADRAHMRALVQAKRDKLAANLQRYETIERNTAKIHAGHPGLPFWLMTVRYGKAEAKGLLAWCDECLQTFKEMK